MKSRDEYWSPAYLDFRVILKAATTFDKVEYNDWVEAHKFELSMNFALSNEIDAGVYFRMQYARAIGVGV